MAYRDMAYEEAKSGLREICRTAKSEDEVKRRIKDELDYQGTTAVTSTRSGPMIMFMVMIQHRDGIVSV